MSNTERIIYIDKSIRKYGQYITVDEVSKKFEISPRQVKRDIEYMRTNLNSPIEYDKVKKGYYYSADYELIAHAGQDFVISYLALQSILKSKQYISLIESDIFKDLNEKVPKEYINLSNNITYQIPQAENIKLEYFEDITESMKEKKCLKILYKNLKNEEKERLVEVHHLCNYGGSWYIICYEDGKDDFRTFNISRVKEMEVTGISFTTHEPSFFKKREEYVNNFFGIFRGKEAHDIKIKFIDKAARIVSTQLWHDKQKIVSKVENINGVETEIVEITFPASEYTEVLNKTLSFGSLAIPLDPPEFVNLWKEEIRKLSQLI